MAIEYLTFDSKEAGPPVVTSHHKALEFLQGASPSWDLSPDLLRKLEAGDRIWVGARLAVALSGYQLG